MVAPITVFGLILAALLSPANCEEITPPLSQEKPGIGLDTPLETAAPAIELASANPSRGVGPTDSSPAPGPSNAEIAAAPEAAPAAVTVDMTAGGVNVAAPAAAVETANLEAPSAIAPASAEQAEALGRQSVENTPRRFTFRINGGVTYDDNLRLRATPLGKESDVILSAGGGFTWNPILTSRRRLTLDYDGTARFYADHDDYNGVDHVAELNGYLDEVDTKVSLRANFSHLTGVLQELRSFEDRNLFSAGASVSQKVSERMTVNASVDYNSGQYDQQQSTTGLAGNLGLSWALTQRIRTGVSVSAGYTDTDSYGKRDYESVQLTAGYHPSERLDFSVALGAQRGARIGSGPNDQTNFTFNAGASYRVTDRTSIAFNGGMGSVTTAVQNGGAAADESFNFSLNASHKFSDKLTGRLNAGRSTPASAAVSNASIETTLVSAGLTQRLGERISLSFDGGYETKDYISTATGNDLGRNEDSWFLRTNLTWRPWENTSVSFFYDYTDVSSNQALLNYDHNRLGLTVGRSW